MVQGLPQGTLTILFTGLTSSRGDEAAQAVLRSHRNLVWRQVQQHAGQEVKRLGDGFMVAFPSACHDLLANHLWHKKPGPGQMPRARRRFRVEPVLSRLGCVR